MTPKQYAKARKRLGYSHQEMGEMLRANRSTSWRYENERTPIPFWVDGVIELETQRKAAA